MSDGQLTTVTFCERHGGAYDCNYGERDRGGEYVPASVARDLAAQLAAEKAITDKLVGDIHTLAVDLRDSQALVAKLIAAWPDSKNRGPVVCTPESGGFYFVNVDVTDLALAVLSQAFPTKEAAILAAIGEGGAP